MAVKRFGQLLLILHLMVLSVLKVHLVNGTFYLNSEYDSHVNDIYGKVGVPRYKLVRKLDWKSDRCDFVNLTSDWSAVIFIRHKRAIASGASSVNALWTDDCRLRNGSEVLDGRWNPLDRFRDRLTHVVLTTNNIDELSTDSFCPFTKLQSLDLSGNRLNDVNKSGLSLNCLDRSLCCGCQLKELSLSANELRIIRNQSFCGLEDLAILRLNYCSLTSIEADAFLPLKSLVIVHLNGNHLKHLHQNLFINSPQLEILTIGGNQLDEAALWSLQRLPNLQFAILHTNRIQSVSNLSAVFNVLTHLKALTLRGNHLSSVDGIRWPLQVNLIHLDLSFNRIRRIDSMFLNSMTSLGSLNLKCTHLKAFPDMGNLTQLEYLDVSGNSLDKLKKSDFAKLSHLKMVNLAENNIFRIERGSFDVNLQLITLNLTSNRLFDVEQTFAGSKIGFLYLDYNYLSQLSFNDFSPSLKLLSVSHNVIDTLDSNEFYSTTNPWALIKVILSFNRLSVLERLFLPPSVESLDLQNNQIRHISYHPRYQSMLDNRTAKLTSVFLQYNNFRVISSDLFGVNRFINYYLRGNPLICSCQMAWINREGSDVGALADLHTLGCHSWPLLTKTSAPKTLTNQSYEDLFCESSYDNDERCIVDHHLDKPAFTVHCHFKCPNRCHCYTTYGYTSIHIHCSSAGLQTIPSGDFRGYGQSRTLFVLWLDGNHLHTLNSSDFSKFTFLNRLYLNKSNIKFIKGNAFKNLMKLKILKLDHNRLETLPSSLFKSLTELRELYLSNNNIKKIADDAFSPLKAIQILHLHSNTLTDFKVWKLNELTKLVEVTLHENSWSCDIYFLEDFHGFIRNQPKIMELTNLTRCYNTEVNAENASIYVLLGLLITCIFLAFVATLFFYYRLELQVLVYSHLNLRVFKRDLDETKGKIYDAFMSYSSDDVEFLFYNLLPKLETIDRPYRLCIHDRDFLPGAVICDSILAAVELSSRTIVLLTENFVKSNWCVFEFKTAHVQMLHDRCPRLLVIVVGDVPKDVDPEIKLYLKTNTYIKWGEKLFWKKLYYAMPELRVVAPAVQPVPMFV